MRHVSLRVSAVIFDLDGVLVDSSAVVDTTWTDWSVGRGLDPAAVLRKIHGTRTRDAVAMFASAAEVDAETARLIAAEDALVDRVRPIPGALELLGQLPAGRWGIATSGAVAVARSRLAHAGLPAPPVFVTAEMVERGKPDPEVYEQAARSLGFAPAVCAVFEDAPSGVRSATAAGAIVVGVLTWAGPELLEAHYAIDDLRAVRVAGFDGSELQLDLEARA